MRQINSVYTIRLIYFQRINNNNRRGQTNKLYNKQLISQKIILNTTLMQH